MEATKTKKYLTLVMILNEENKQVLLGMKKRGFGVGRWNGFGGKVLPNESLKECALRETNEECGLMAKNIEQIGNIVFEFVGDPQLLDVNIFRCTEYTGEITESEEMFPKWFAYNDVPFEKMWPDDYQWYPYLFRNEKFKGYYLFEGHDKILKEELYQVSEAFDES